MRLLLSWLESMVPKKKVVRAMQQYNYFYGE